MKNVLLFFAAATLLAACGGNQQRIAITSWGGSGEVHAEVQQQVFQEVETINEEGELVTEEVEVWVPVTYIDAFLSAENVQVPLDVVEQYDTACYPVVGADYGLCVCPVILGSVSTDSIEYVHEGSFMSSDLPALCVAKYGDGTVGTIQPKID